MNNLKNKMIKIINKIKNHPILGLFILSFVFIIFIIVYINFSNKKEVNIVNNKTIRTPVSIQYINSPQDKTNNNEYLFNRFLTDDQVLAYKWTEDNKIIYATKKGLFELWENKQITQLEMKSAILPPKGNFLIYQNANGIYVYDIISEKNLKIDIVWNEILANEFGNYLLYKKDEKYILFDVNTNLSKTLNIDSNFQINWVVNQNKFYAFNKESNQVDIYDTSLQKIFTFNTESNIDLISISTEINKYIYKKDSFIFIQDINNLNSYRTETPANNLFNIYWLNTGSILIIEKIDRNIFDLYDQNIWLIENESERKYIGNTTFITNKINTDNKILINSSNEALLFSENKGNLWIVSLKLGYLPIYKNEGLDFYTTRSLNREAP